MTGSKANTCKRKDSSALVTRLSKAQINLLRRIARQGPVSIKDLDAGTLNDLIGRGAVVCTLGKASVNREGKQALRRAKLEQDEDQIYAAQHQDRIEIPAAETSKRGEKRATRINRAESPLMQLANRKRSDGQPYLSKHLVEAGNRLRADFERGQIVPSLGIDWSHLGETVGSVSRNAKGKCDKLALSDTALSAQQRFHMAIDHVGEELSGALVDFCCFLKGLEDIEKSRQWPARSAKQIIALALSRLARHYGMSGQAIGQASRGIRHWGADDYRPTV